MADDGAMDADTEVVAFPVVQAGPAHRKATRAETTGGRPRIIQYLHPEAAERLLILLGIKLRSEPPLLVLDDQDQTWSLEHMPETSPVEAERGRLIWRRLWVPPLPHGDGD